MHTNTEFSEDPKAPNLYRYISDLKWVMQALKERQFRPRYSDEDFQWAAEAPCCLWVPMVSFCEIPLDKCRHHRDAYGDYVVGFTKTWGMKMGLNPVLYISANSSLAGRIRSQIKRKITKRPLVPNEFGALWPLVPYMKPDEGYQTYRGPIRASTECNKAFEQEMEWRFVPRDWETLVSSHQLDRVEERIAKSNDFSGEGLAFEMSDIDILIVKSAAERSSILELHPELSLGVKFWDQF